MGAWGVGGQTRDRYMGDGRMDGWMCVGGLGSRQGVDMQEMDRLMGGGQTNRRGWTDE